MDMRIELLYFGGCPTYRNAEEALRRVLVEEGVEAKVDLVEVGSDQEARRLGFAGSPTLRIDGRDPFPVPERARGPSVAVSTRRRKARRAPLPQR